MQDFFATIPQGIPSSVINKLATNTNYLLLSIIMNKQWSFLPSNLKQVQMQWSLDDSPEACT